MLTQKMTKELLFAALDFEKAEHLELARKTALMFNDTLYSLRDGNPELGLPPTNDGRLLRQIGTVDELWKQYNEVVQGIVEKESVDGDDVAKIAELNLPLLKQMNKCVTLYERQASGAALEGKKALAVAVNLSGKQRMLSQKMTKELLLIAFGFEVETNELLLTDTYGLFARTLAGLQKGDDILELSAAINTPVIVEQLNTVESVWEAYYPVVKSAADGVSIDLETLAKVDVLNMSLLKEMNKAVGMYESLSK